MTTTPTTAHPTTGTCGKCGGTGRINAFSHIANGVCFPCSGTGRIEIKARAVSPRRKSTQAQVNVTDLLSAATALLSRVGQIYAFRRPGETYWLVQSEDYASVYVWDNGDTTVTLGITERFNATEIREIKDVCRKVVATLTRP